MELVTVKIKGLVNTSRYGALSSGDLLRTDPEFAKHLVEECGAGEYVTGKAADPMPARISACARSSVCSKSSGNAAANCA